MKGFTINPQALAHLFFATILFIVYATNAMQEDMNFMLVLLAVWNGLLGWSKMKQSKKTV